MMTAISQKHSQFSFITIIYGTHHVKSFIQFREHPLHLSLVPLSDSLYGNR